MRSCLIVAAAALVGAANAQFVQQGGKLVGTGAVGNARQGNSVALSADGNTAIVGGYWDNNFVGAAWVYTRSGGVWTQQGSKLVGTGAVGNAFQGNSVALSADGNTAIVGGRYDSGSLSGAPGAAWVYTRSGGTWTQQGNKLVGTGAVGNAFQGNSVALSADGNTAIVGGFGDNNFVGAAWVYTRSGGVWTQQSSKLVGTGAVGPNGAQQGYSVALSADGNTALVGGPSDHGGAGAASLFTRSEGVWTQQGSKLVGSGAVGNAEQGWSVALSADGNTAIVGGFNDNYEAGAVWVYMCSGGVWTQQGSKLVGSGAVGPNGAQQGTSVALSADGNTAIVGGPCDSGDCRVNTGIGAAWVFAVPGTAAQAPSVSPSAATSITTSSATLRGNVNADGLDTHVWFLYSTDGTMSGALSTPQQDVGSGTVAVPFSANIAGLAFSTTYYFQAVAQSSAATVQGSILSFATARPPTVSTSAATSITNSGAILGGGVNPNGLDTHVWFFYSTNSSLSGAVSTPQQDVGSGTVAVPFSANIAALAISTTYYFQATAQNSGGTAQGSILSFTTTSSAPPAFVQQGSKLVGTGAVGNAQQGTSVALSADGNTAIVGGLYDNNYAGAAWVYTRSGGLWTQQGSKLVGAGAAGTAVQQGFSVALSADGNTAIVGGLYDNNFAGAAWVYTRSGGLWTQQGSKLVGTGAVGDAMQGFSVALSADGNTAIVGGYMDNNYAGAAWVYTRSGGVWTQQGGKLVGTGVVFANQGSSVALSADGNTAIVGGFSDNGGAGAAWVYTRSGAMWTQGNKLVGTGAVGDANQGFSVALSADGNTAIVGGRSDNNEAGAAWVYTRSGAVWTQQGTKLVGTGAAGSAQQGISVSLSADGSAAIVGGFADNGGAGAAWVFAVNVNTVPSPPQINSGGVVNNASYDLGASGSSGAAPGEIAAVFGTGLTDGTSCLPPACNPAFGSAGKLNTTMAGAQVTVNGTPAPIFYAAPMQLGIQIPFEVTGTSATVSVSVAGQASTSATVALAPVAPGIFTASADGKGAGAITHVDGSAVTAQNPAQPGELVILYATGLGQVAPAVPTGALPASASSTFAPVTLTMGGINFIPDFAGLAGCCVGLNQINARVPFGVSSGNAVPVVLNIGGKSSNTATIAVQ